MVVRALPKPSLSRRQEFGSLFYGSLGIAQTDIEARANRTAKNYSFFGAPVGLIVTIDRLLYGLLIVRPDWREILWLGVTAHPTAEWIASQMVTIRKCQLAVPVRAGKEGT
jgi:hypothetical protein